MRGKPKKGKRAMRRQRRRKRARFEEGPDFRAQSARKPAGPTVYSCPTRGRKGFFDTLRTVLFKHCPLLGYIVILSCKEAESRPLLQRLSLAQDR